jgi:hypothetical protein
MLAWLPASRLVTGAAFGRTVPATRGKSPPSARSAEGLLTADAEG